MTICQKQFYSVWYGGEMVSQILEPVGLSEEQARNIMVEKHKKSPYLHGIPYATPDEVETMIRVGKFRSYDIPKCQTKNCHICGGPVTN